ncbi:bifunctional phosphopantothenoylcysteine decarboxylase/phosphopantothenate--cysteine ligase CoaBC [Paucilactobacillus suebicus]|nr:bifunctional phosphopantothenoylcysteine decarboxylase/phosphopantothenate--cysteine ligase CoaBC [Paucilactobacillus suebicus]
MSNIALHVTGGIASYKAVELLRALQKDGNEVRVAMTPAATEFVTKTTFGSLTKYPVLTSLWGDDNHSNIAHIELADWTDVAVVAPATADTIAKIANGIADNAVTSTILATNAPKVVVPAMNSHMWSNPATERNVNQLIADGITVIAPEEGRLAEGYSGKGRFPALNTITSAVAKLLNQSLTLSGKKILVTAGGTRESIDPVRFIGNRSSGKMGIAIANAAQEAGADVTLIAGQIDSSSEINSSINLLRVESTEQMAKAVEQNFDATDALIMAAAVADYTPSVTSQQKMKKSENTRSIFINFKETPDILKTFGSRKTHQLIVGFAAETQNLIDNATKKLNEKNADYIIANNVNETGVGFGSDDNQVTILQPGHEPQKWAKMSKKLVAEKIIKLISNQLLQGD